MIAELFTRERVLRIRAFLIDLAVLLALFACSAALFGAPDFLGAQRELGALSGVVQQRLFARADDLARIRAGFASSLKRPHDRQGRRRAACRGCKKSAQPPDVVAEDGGALHPQSASSVSF